MRFYYRCAHFRSFHFLVSLLFLSFFELSYAAQEPLNVEAPPEARSKRVAIIGAGSAGASTAYYLRKYAGNSSTPVDITVFERSPYVGGRTATINVFDDPSLSVELGASIFVQVNKILMDASKEFRLNVTSTDHVRPREAEDDLGVWDGKKFVFRHKNNGYYWWDVTKLLWRYGLSPIRTQNLMKSTVGKFLELYKQPHFPWKSLSEAAVNVGLVNVTTSTGLEYLRKNGISDSFSRDIIQASTRVNYGQNLPLIHGLETMVCMATDGAVAVEGGNWQIFESMLKKSRANMNLNTTAKEIRRNNNETFTVSYLLPNKDVKQSVFDHVVLASPLQFSGVEISPALRRQPDTIPYVQLHVTLFASPHRLSPRFFSLPVGSSVPETILTTLPPGIELGDSKDGVGPAGFWSVSTLRSVKNPKANRTPDHDSQSHYVYKIFSPARVTADFLTKLLGIENVPHNQTGNEKPPSITDIPKEHISWYHEHTWNSYPYLYPRVTFEEIEVAPNFWYTSGIESFISTMETSALSGMNVAGLISARWAKDSGLFSEGGNGEKIEL